MRLLLDTHTLLWAVNDDARLSEQARALLEDTENSLFLSVVSLWEIAIKVTIGKLNLNSSFDNFVARGVVAKGVVLLPITEAHLSALVTLPLHYRDPFDRLIVAQALTEDLTLLSRDGNLTDYGVKLLW